ncbi:MAG TPA: Ig-like domain-containing protein, partial [Gaiellaceae bacterium]|nr:Ig-like domain-containing protein [Gaiellaceae bacterium]
MTGDRGRALLLAALLSAIALLASAGSAEASSCQTSGPIAGSYTVTVCLAAPASGSTLTGAVTVSATATATGTSPGVQRMVFYLRGVYLLTDYQAPFTFTLRSDEFVDGTASLEVEALMRDGFTSQRASIPITLQNGVVGPPPPRTGFAPTSGTTPAPGQPVVAAAFGDGAGGEQNA